VGLEAAFRWVAGGRKAIPRPLKSHLTVSKVGLNGFCGRGESLIPLELGGFISRWNFFRLDFGLDAVAGVPGWSVVVQLRTRENGVMARRKSEFWSGAVIIRFEGIAGVKEMGVGGMAGMPGMA
jgi:hypothetical protein